MSSNRSLLGTATVQRFRLGHQQTCTRSAIQCRSRYLATEEAWPLVGRGAESARAVWPLSPTKIASCRRKPESIFVRLPWSLAA